jgi:hypothetical protein
MSTSEAAKTSEESNAAYADSLNKQLESIGSTGVVTPLLGALTKSVENSKKLIDEGHSLARQGPVYAMVFLSVALVAFAISFAELHSSDSADFIAGLVIASVLLIVAGILQLVNNVAESRAAAQQVSELSSANERIAKYAIEQNAAIAARRQEGLPTSSPHKSP